MNAAYTDLASFAAFGHALAVSGHENHSCRPRHTRRRRFTISASCGTLNAQTGSEEPARNAKPSRFASLPSLRATPSRREMFVVEDWYTTAARFEDFYDLLKPLVPWIERLALFVFR
jgi:hypothetical protein